MFTHVTGFKSKILSRHRSKSGYTRINAAINFVNYLHISRGLYIENYRSNAAASTLKFTKNVEAVQLRRTMDEHLIASTSKELPDPSDIFIDVNYRAMHIRSKALQA